MRVFPYTQKLIYVGTKYKIFFFNFHLVGKISLNGADDDADKVKILCENLL